MRVLITGVSGFIGAHIFQYFSEEGNQVIGWDICDPFVGWETYRVDLTNIIAIKERLSKDKPDIIIHCAGAADVGKSIDNPEGDYQGNVTTTHNLMFAIHQMGFNNLRVVFLSSAGVYGNPAQLPIIEDMAVNPLSPYALHKVMCENIFQYFHTNYEMDLKIVRIFSAYGEGLKKQIFWDMYQKVKSTGHLCMYGTGNESRDYINIHDLVRAVYLVATKAPKKEFVYNVANGEEITIREATECFADVAGIDRQKIIFSGKEKEGNPINWRADISRLKKLGYKKQINFSDGIEKYVAWVRGLTK